MAGFRRSENGIDYIVNSEKELHIYEPNFRPRLWSRFVTKENFEEKKKEFLKYRYSIDKRLEK